MNLKSILGVVIAIVASGSVTATWAGYDSAPAAGSSDMCTQVRFSQFTPAQYSQEKNKVEVAPKSEFSFHASKETFPKTISVTIKGETVPTTVTQQHDGFRVTGHIPETIKGAFIRIEIKAKGPSNCVKGDGWLLKVAN